MKVVKKIFFILIVVFIAACIAYFAKLNDKYVSINFIVGKISEIQIWLLTLFAFLAGIIITIIFFSIEFFSWLKREKTLKKELIKLKNEISLMRSKELSDIDENLISQKVEEKEDENFQNKKQNIVEQQSNSNSKQVKVE